LATTNPVAMPLPIVSATKTLSPIIDRVILDRQRAKLERSRIRRRDLGHTGMELKNLIGKVSGLGRQRSGKLGPLRSNAAKLLGQRDKTAKPSRRKTGTRRSLRKSKPSR
jgi:hypothetical protein